MLPSKILSICKEDNSSKLALLLSENKTLINTELDVFGQKVVHIAASFGAILCLKILYDLNSATLLSRTTEGRAPIHFASLYGNVEAVKFILAKFPECKSFEDNSYQTPLHLCAWNGHIRVASLLIENKAQINLRAKDNITPLHHAAMRGEVGITKLLLENGAIPTIKTKFKGKTAIDLADSANFSNKNFGECSKVISKFISNNNQSTHNCKSHKSKHSKHKKYGVPFTIRKAPEEGSWRK